MNGRTVWWAKDSGWWRRERIVELGEEFGPVGPAVIDWLSCEAKAQNAGGVVKTGYRAIARGVFAGTEQVCPVVSRAVRLGLLDDFEEAERVFTCRISGWSVEQARARETVKKAGQRARRDDDPPANPDIPAPGPDGPPPAGPPLSPPVPESPLTGQDSINSNPPTPKGETASGVDVGEQAPVRPSSKRKRDVEHFEAQMRAWASAHFPGADPRGVAVVVNWARDHGLQATAPELEAWARRAGEQWIGMLALTDPPDDSALSDAQRARIAELGARATAINEAAA